MLMDNDVVIDSSGAAAPRVIAGLDGLRTAAGTDLGVSPWVTIDQDLVNRFARRTVAGSFQVSGLGPRDRDEAKVAPPLFPPMSPNGCPSLELAFARMGRAEEPLRPGATCL